MSIGQLGSSGQSFRDFLGGGQRDIGQGLQAVLSNYASPNGNFLRLENRTQGMFQLTSGEYQTTYDRDAQNSFAQTWYNEYRAVLSLRAEALKKKLNRAYVRTLENSIYAPMRPDERWAPNANRDRNDISAETPLAFYSGAVIDNPPNEVEEIDNNLYAHPDWFGPDKQAYGGTSDAYNDIRRYINSQAPLQDMDGDGTAEVQINGSLIPADDPVAYPTFKGPHYKAPVDSTGYVTSDGAADNQYYDLWRTNAGPVPSPYAYDLNDPGVNSNAWFEEIAKNMNVPPSTDTRNFVRSNASNRYYIETFNGMTSTDFALLPTFITSNSNPTTMQFTTAQRDAIVAGGHGMTNGDFTETSPGSGIYTLNNGIRFVDPDPGVSNQRLFAPDPGSFPYGSGTVGGITLNPKLAQPLGATLDEQDFNASKGHLPPYQQGFLDSWYEARQIQKREAQIEAAYKAYVDNAGDIKAKNPDYTYDQIMDQVFSGIDQLAKGSVTAPTSPPSNYPPGTPPLPPVNPHPDAPSNYLDNVSPISGMVPYGYYYTPPSTFEGTINSVYQVGADYSSPKTPSSEASIYSILNKRLEMMADPVGSVPAPPALPPVSTPGPPAPPPPTPRTSIGDSKLYVPIPVGAAESNGQPDVNDDNGTDDLVDTTKSAFGGNTMDVISNLFVGRQWDYAPGFVPGGAETATPGTKDIAPVKYDAETISSHLKVSPVLWYDPYAKSSSMISAMTLSPPIEGFALQAIATGLALGRLDDVANNLLGGPFFHVGGGSDSKGIVDLDGTSTAYSFSGTAIGAGVGGIYWGHTSAIGTIGKVEDLMDNSGGQGGDIGPALQAMNLSLGILANIGGASKDDISYFPNVGIGGFHADLNIPIPIPIPMAGVFFLNLPMTTYGAASYDILTDYMHEFLDAMKHEVIDSVSAYSYATSGGYAMDSYGMRGEYHFTEKTAWSTLQKMPELIGIFDLGGFLDQAKGLLGINSYTINDYNLREDGVFGGEQRHSMNAGEARELDTGAFFSTAAFLSQFQLNDLSYSYWTGTHQNEEIANMDTLRMLALTGKEIMKFLNKAIFAAAGRLNAGPPSMGWAVVLSVLDLMLSSYQQQLNENMMWDLLLRDQNERGFVTSDRISSSSLTAEGYDFIEDEKKLFAYDYNTTRDGGQLGAIGALAQWGTGSFELPNQVLNGMANTRRYKPFLTGVDGAAGRQGYGAAFGIDGRRAHELSRHEGDTTRYDDNWDIKRGFWDDTGMGDINEVYVRKNVVDYNGAVSEGLSGLTPNVTTHIDRYVGSHGRIVGRNYDGASPLNLQSFRTGYYHDKYFGTFINAADATAKGAAAVNANTVRVGVTGDVDGRSNVILQLHGGQKYYDRRYDYTLNVKGLDSTAINLTANQALAPVLGGRMLLARVDQNNLTQALGESTIGVENPLTRVLYEHMHLKSDGSNAQLVREYRDVFNNGFLDDMFLTASANATTGGGVTSSIRIKFRQIGTAATSAAVPVNFGDYEERRQEEIAGTRTVTRADGTSVTQNLLREPGLVGTYDVFKNTNRAMAEIYLSSFYAFKRPPATPAK
ncbi:MAG: hypothetical protein IGS03_01695 [Candidatus Sericytochromatia bacterium]|nr:hypothetical protein [Candidatus Sericytochromatia bacterium]